MWIELFANIIFVVWIVKASELPPFIEVCYRDDPAINECVARNVKIIQPKLIEGIPSMSIPSFQPLKIPAASLSVQNFNVNMTNINIYDIHKCDIEKAKLNIQKLSFDLALECNGIPLESDYWMKGKLLAFVFDTPGHLNGSLERLSLKIHFELGQVSRKGKEYLTIKDSQWDMHAGTFHVSFDKLFGDNKELNEATSKVLNDNADILLEEFIPVIKNILKDVFTGIHEKMFRKFPLDVLFPKKRG